MRVLSAAALSALVLAGFTLPSVAQDEPDLPGVRVTIMPKSYLNPGNKVRPRTARDCELSNLTGNTFLSSNYDGIPGFARFPLPDPLDLPYSRARYVLSGPRPDQVSLRPLSVRRDFQNVVKKLGRRAELLFRIGEAGLRVRAGLTPVPAPELR